MKTLFDLLYILKNDEKLIEIINDKVRVLSNSKFRVISIFLSIVFRKQIKEFSSYILDSRIFRMVIQIFYERGRYEDIIRTFEDVLDKSKLTNVTTLPCFNLLCKSYYILVRNSVIFLHRINSFAKRKNSFYLKKTHFCLKNLFI